MHRWLDGKSCEKRYNKKPGNAILALQENGGDWIEIKLECHSSLPRNCAARRAGTTSFFWSKSCLYFFVKKFLL
jgi:hypothetical protein